MKGYQKLAGISALLLSIWVFRGQIMFAFDWREMDPESFAIRTQDWAEGHTGPVQKTWPCMANQTTIELNLKLAGPFPAGLGRDIVMSVHVSSDALMVGQLYLGPPVRELHLPDLPICIVGPDLPDLADGDADARLIVDFIDTENRRFVTFQGEESFPILAWRNVVVDWRGAPWLMERSGNYTQTMVTPY